MRQWRESIRYRRAAVLALAVAVVAAGATGCTAGRIGLVDSPRILAESAKALRYQKEIDDRESAMTADLQMLVNRLPKEDLEARRIQYFRELQALRAELETSLNREVREAIHQVVREKRLRGVILKGPVVYSKPGTTVDITQDVIDRLR